MEFFDRICVLTDSKIVILDKSQTTQAMKKSFSFAVRFFSSRMYGPPQC